MDNEKKVYICFGGDEDMSYYRTLQMWNANKNINFEFNNVHDMTNIRVFEEENIKRNLRLRMNNSKLMLVIVGEKTKFLYKYVRWEIELALEKDIPIIVANINGTNGIDYDLCPPILRGKCVVHVPFKQKSILHALQYWDYQYQGCKKQNKIDLYWDLSVFGL